MVTPTSASGGFLQPAANPPLLEGDKLEDFFQAYLVGLSGLDPTLVRPAFQTEPPNIPQKGNVWISFYFIDEDSDAYPWTDEVNDGAASQLQINEEFAVHCCFYGLGAGSAARATAKQVRNNLAIAQNREPLFNAGMGLISVPKVPQPAPVLTKETWNYRIDMDIRIRRNIVQTYPVLSLESADAALTIDSQTREIDRNINVEESP